MIEIGSDRVIAGVELGGTKAIVVVGRGREIFERVTVPTSTPENTLGAVAAQLEAWRVVYRPEALGIASFGPIALDARHGPHGHMLATPKPAWSGADVLGPLAAVLSVPTMLHTDVTAAALAEGRWGAATGLRDFVYLTIGTGIGMGVVAGGQPVSGRMHPEAGHLRVRRVPGDIFPGVCPFHADCLEGLASGPAIAARAGVTADLLSDDDPAWMPVADALAEAMAILLLTLASERIVIGGGVGTGRPHLLEMVQSRIGPKLASYLPGVTDSSLSGMVVRASLGTDAGPLGTLALGAMSRTSTRSTRSTDLSQSRHSANGG